MAYTVLFIGGRNNGKRLQVKELTPYFKLDVYDGFSFQSLNPNDNPRSDVFKVECYWLQRMRGNGDRYVYVLEGLKFEDVIDRLVANYAPIV